MQVDRRSLLLVAAGGAVGALVRWAVVSITGTAGRFPWWTLGVNLLGCALLGILWQAPRSLALLAGTGFCGGLTTFSTFSVEVAALVDTGDAAIALAYLAVSVVTGTAAIQAGRRVPVHRRLP